MNSTRPIRRVCSREVPIPYAAHLEQAALPQACRHCRRGAGAGEGRMIDFRMPSLGADMEAGTLVEWLVKPGDNVKRGDVVAVVETQKGAIEIEIFNNGIVSELAVPVGQLVPVGTVLARLDGQAVAAPAIPPPTPAPPALTAASIPVPQPAPSGRLQVSPAARRRAAERGVDFQRIKGTGPGGAITIADVEAATTSPTPRSRFAVRASIPRPCVRLSPPR